VASRIPIIAYHAIGPCSRDEDKHNLFVSTEAFRNQMDYLAAHKRVVSLDQAVSGQVRGDRPAVAITFDDGYRNFIHRAVPILRASRFPCKRVRSHWMDRHEERLDRAKLL